MAPMEERVLTVEEVASRLRVTPAAVRQWLRSGRLRGFKAGPKVWRTSEEALADFLERQQGKPGG